jgi:peptidoglycan/xylan/chitin deacetylase (PgdA/CDA1 family)
MIAIARSPRRLAPLVSLGLAALLVAVPASPASAATYTVRLQAGPQRSVVFDGGWHITASSTVSLATPVTVVGSARHRVSTEEAWIRVATGVLAGRWVRESRTAYIPGVVAPTTYDPPRIGALAAGTYELYRFTTTGAMTTASPWTVAGRTPIETTGRAWINGRPYVRLASGERAGWWLPGATSTPRSVACTAGSPPAATSGHLVRSVPGATGELALTFDMGGRLTDALAIMHLLELERVCATIFPTAAAAQTSIGTRVLAEIRDHPELFEMGNHTVHHCNLRDGGGGAACPSTGVRPSAAFVAAELQDADAVITTLAGRSSVPFWRPPYGAADAQLVADAAEAGYPFTMLWTTDTIDWRPLADGGPTAAQIASKVIAGRKAGGIALMHLGGYNTRNALFALISGLEAVGYTPTTLSALYRTGH